MKNQCFHTVLVTGASRGIGYAIAKAFAQNGFRVFANYNKTEEPLKSLGAQLAKAGHTLIPIFADVTNKSNVDRMMEQIGGVDILVNNAGIAQFKQFVDMTESDWDRMLTVNLKSVFLCSKGVIPGMIHNKRGKIINISSIWGVTGGSCETHYSAAKAGIIGFTKALAKEMAPSGIQVNCIAPGVIETDMIKNLSVADRDSIMEETPLQRIGRAEDVARAALFLAEDSFITGEVLNVNGGFHI